MREEQGVGSCPECGTPGSFTGQLVCQGCYVPFALMAAVHAAAEPPPFLTAPTVRLARPGAPRPAAAGPDTPEAAPPRAEPPRAAAEAEYTRLTNLVPGARPGSERTRRETSVHALRLCFPGGDVVEVAAGFSIRLGRDPQLCPAVVFLADRDNLSRIHARVGLETDGTAWITDEDSTNGTYVGGYRLATNQRAPLRPGDTFRLAADVHVSVLP